MMRILFALLVGFMLLGGATPATAANDFFYEEDFEQPIETWTDGWRHAQLGSRNRLSRIEDGYRGYGIRVNVPTGQHYGSSLEKALPNLHEAWATYWIRVPHQIEPTSQGKFGLGFAGNHYANCGQGGAGDNPGCWTARGAYSCRGRNSDCEALNVAFYLYHPNQTSEFGDLEPLAMRLEYDRWYCIQTYVEMNTIGQSDGVIAGFINGEWVYNLHAEFRTEANPTKIKGLWWNQYEGGKQTATADMAFDYDELVISSQFVEREGCLSQEDNPFAPEPPSEPTTTTTTTEPEPETTTITTQVPDTTVVAEPSLEGPLRQWPQLSWWVRFIWNQVRWTHMPF